MITKTKECWTSFLSANVFSHTIRWNDTLGWDWTKCSKMVLNFSRSVQLVCQWSNRDRFKLFYGGYRVQWKKKQQTQISRITEKLLNLVSETCVKLGLPKNKLFRIIKADSRTILSSDVWSRAGCRGGAKATHQKEALTMCMRLAIGTTCACT